MTIFKIEIIEEEVVETAVDYDSLTAEQKSKVHRGILDLTI